MANSICKSSTAFMLGLSVGAGVALLFAPMPGIRTRRLLARKTRRGNAYVKDRADALLNSASDLFEKGQKQALQGKESLERALNMGKRAYRQSIG
jgi:gas vesicle protein